MASVDYTRNAVILECLKCGDVIQSKHRHDFRWCKCKAIAVDGGDDYARFLGMSWKMLKAQNEQQAIPEIP